MFEKLLIKISELDFSLFWPIKKGNNQQNTIIFWNSDISNVEKYKDKYLDNLSIKKQSLNELIMIISLESDSLSKIENYILDTEIEWVIHKVLFLEKIYDWEACKIDSNCLEWDIDFDFWYYNDLFFWVSYDDILYKTDIKNFWDSSVKFSIDEVTQLLDFTKSYIGWFKYKFWNYAYMSHHWGELLIPEKEIYNLNEIITLFFHEMVHFLRSYNNKKNYNNDYIFIDYLKVEEWFAIYNEYLYWSKLIKWLEYQPYYDICYWIILNEDISEEEKIWQIYNILKNKWFSKQKSLNYYYRFYRYTYIWSKNLFLKDLVYTKWYKTVKDLIAKDSLNYDRLFSWKVWLSVLNTEYINYSNNFDSKLYFDKILDLINKKI